MKIVVLDGYTENPGDLSWEGLEKLGELTVHDRTSLTDEEEIKNMSKMIDLLEDNDDVQNVWHNWEQD